MSKSIYEEAIKVVTYLQELNSHLKDNCRTIYISSRDITTLENLLIHSHKQEKLLELYEALVAVKDDMLSYCEVVDDDYYDSKELATSFEKQIKELENE